MTLTQWAPWALCLGALPATWALRRKLRGGWLGAAAVNLLLSVYNAATHQWGFIPMALAVAVIQVSNYRAWKKDDAQEAPDGAGCAFCRPAHT